MLMVAPLRIVDRLGDRIHQITPFSLRRAGAGRSPQRCQVVIERVIGHARVATRDAATPNAVLPSGEDG